MILDSKCAWCDGPGARVREQGSTEALCSRCFDWDNEQRNLEAENYDLRQSLEQLQQDIPDLIESGGMTSYWLDDEYRINRTPSAPYFAVPSSEVNYLIKELIRQNSDVVKIDDLKRQLNDRQTSLNQVRRQLEQLRTDAVKLSPVIRDIQTMRSELEDISALFNHVCETPSCDTPMCSPLDDCYCARINSAKGSLPDVEWIKAALERSKKMLQDVQDAFVADGL